jgi:hypothetical protein
MKDDFYIGYLDKAPAGLKRYLKKYIIVLVLIAPVVAVLLAASQHPFYPSVFEFLQYRTFEGVVQEQPYPMLLIERPADATDVAAYSRYYLVQEGKLGAQEAVAGLNDQRIRLEGTLIYRDDQTMIEIKSGTVEVIGNGVTGGSGAVLGSRTLIGEIVDSKCYLGVMNPGSTKPHRGCAVRCISGGMPPVLVVQEPGGTSYYMVQGSDSRMVNKEILDWVAKPVEITGEVVQLDNLLVLKAEPDTFRNPS